MLTHGGSDKCAIRNRMSQSRSEYKLGDRGLYVLHHAVEGPIFGLGMIEELARHGYRILRRATDEIRDGTEIKTR